MEFSIMTLKFKRFTAIALMALTALGGAVGSAQAGGKHHKFHFKNHHFNNFHSGRTVVVIGGGGRYSCDYYYDKWQWTGSKYWKRQYYACVYSW
jgi:hypothetical protein